MPILGNYKVTWEYDAVKHRTYCTISDLEGEVVVDINVKLIRSNEYDKVRARTLSFNKALRKIAKKELMREVDIQLLRRDFAELPNRGVI